MRDVGHQLLLVLLFGLEKTHQPDKVVVDRKKLSANAGSIDRSASCPILEGGDDVVKRLDRALHDADDECPGGYGGNGGDGYKRQPKAV